MEHWDLTRVHEANLKLLKEINHASAGNIKLNT